MKHDIHVNCGSPDMIDQYGRADARAAGSRCGSIRASATAIARRSTRAARNRSTASGTSNLKIASSAPQNGTCRSQGCTCTSARAPIWTHLSQVCGAMERAALVIGSRSDRSAPAAGCRCRIAKGEQYVDIAAYFKLWDAARHGWPTQFGHEISLEIEPGRYLVGRKRLPGQRDSRHQTDGRQHVLFDRRRIQQSSSADPVRRLSPDGDLPGGWLGSTAAADRRK